MNKEHLTVSEMEELNKGRAAMYKLLASVYKVEADKEFLNKLSSLANIKVNLEDEFASDYKSIANYLGQDYKKKDISIEDELAVDYAKMFLGVGRNQSDNAFPYESVYTSSKGVLMQEAMEEVAKIYAEHEFQLRDDVNVPADHLYLELEFMSKLCASMNESDEYTEECHKKLYKVQLDFIKNHLKNWVSRFCSDVQSFADTDYYKAFANITDKFIDLDYKVLKSVL